jgi:hypothetical protein
VEIRTRFILSKVISRPLSCVFIKSVHNGYMANKIIGTLFVSVIFSAQAFAADVFKCTDKKQKEQNITSVLVAKNDLYCRCPAKNTKEDSANIKKVNSKKECVSPCYLADNNNSTDRCQIASDVITQKWKTFQCPSQCSEKSFESSTEPSQEEREAGKKKSADCQFIKEAICKPKLVEETDSGDH